MKKLEKVVIASKNPAKIERFRNLLSRYAKEVVNLNGLGTTNKPEEKGGTAEENAKIKARYYSCKTGFPAFGEDEALYVDFLPKNKQPGVHVRRVEGKDEVTDNELLSYWENLVSKVPKEKRTGRWHIAYCLAKPDGNVKIITFNHPIQFFSPSSTTKIPGWPMSSLEGPLEFGKPHSELTDKEMKSLNQQIDREITKMMKELFRL